MSAREERSDAVSASLADRGHMATTGMGATKGLDAEAARARKAVKVLDSLVVPIIADDEALPAQWKSAKRFRGRTPSLSFVGVEEPVIVEPKPEGVSAAQAAQTLSVESKIQ